MEIVSFLLTFLVGIFILLGSICGIYFKNNKKFTDLSISLAFGIIISLIVFEIIPELFGIMSVQVGIVRSILSIIVLSLIGIILLKLLDLFIPNHEHESHSSNKYKNDKKHNAHLYHIGIVSSIAIIVHNIIEGMSLYLVSQESILSGLLLFIGIGLHNIPIGFVISSTLYSLNHSNKKILKISLLVSLSTFVGGFIMFVLGGVNELVEGILLGLTLGMLIYISFVELLHQIYHMKNKKLSIVSIIAGIILPIISVLIEHII